MNKYISRIPGLKGNTDKLKSQSLCNMRNEYYFNSIEECESHMQGVSTYGIRIVNSIITEEIRKYKNMAEQLLESNLIVGNLTLYGSKYWDEQNITNEIKKNDKLLFRLYLFNNHSYHKDLNIIYVNNIIPFIEYEYYLTFDSILKSIEYKDFTFIVMFGFILFAITLLFIILWIPMIININTSIYKTKNMLSIIPMHILASQEKINDLLNIESEKSKIDNN